MKVADWGAAVTDTLDALLGDTPVDLAIGHSAGAATLLEAVATGPHRFTRIVLEDPPGACDVRRPAWAAQLEQEVRAARRDAGRIRRMLLRQNPTWDERDAAAAVEGLAASEIEVIAEMERAGMGYRVTDLVGVSSAPTLLMLADEPRSALSGPARAATLATLPRKVTVAHFASGHVIHRDAFPEYVKTVVGWARAG